MTFSNLLEQKCCSNRQNAPISQEIVLEIVGLASAFVHLHYEISERLLRVWVHKRVIIDNFRKTTLFNAGLVPRSIRDWYVDTEEEQDTTSECDSDCEWE